MIKIPLIAHYPLQEDSGSTAYDFSGNNRDGQVSGSPEGSTGLLGRNCYNFNGTDENIENIDVSIPDLGSSFTISLWLKWDSPTQYQRAVNLRTNNRINLQSTGTSGSSIRFQIDGSTNKQIYVDSSANVVDKWRHFVLWWDGSTMELFVDNVSQGTNSASSMQNPNFGSYLGAGGTSEYFDGKMADVRIYDHAISQSVRQFLYESVANEANLETAEKTI